MDEEIKQQLINDFRAYLDADTPSVETPDESARVVDLYTLLQEFVALKNEVKIEARHFKSALEQFQSALDALNAEKSALSQSLEQGRAVAQKEKDAALRGLLLQILDFNDRLFEGLQAAQSYRKPRFSLFGRKREQRLIEGLRNGQSLLLKRLDQMLASYEVLPIPVVDKPFDPMTMRAAELEHRPDIENGRVTGELRKGYFRRDEVLRTAEVKVNKVE